MVTKKLESVFGNYLLIGVMSLLLFVSLLAFYFLDRTLLQQVMFMNMTTLYLLLFMVLPFAVSGNITLFLKTIAEPKNIEDAVGDILRGFLAGLFYAGLVLGGAYKVIGSILNIEITPFNVLGKFASLKLSIAETITTQKHIFLTSSQFLVRYHTMIAANIHIAKLFTTNIQAVLMTIS